MQKSTTTEHSKTSAQAIQRSYCRLRQSHRAKPKRCAAYNNRGVAKRTLKQYKEAITDYDKAIELDPKYVKAYNNRGFAYRELGKKEEADADFSTWAELIGESTKEIKETSETVKSKIEAIGKQTEETQAFQKTLEALKETISKDFKQMGLYFGWAKMELLADYISKVKLQRNLVLT